MTSVAAKMMGRTEPEVRTPVPVQPILSKEEKMRAVVFKSAGSVAGLH